MISAATISVNGSCCMMDGPLSVPDSCAAMTAVAMWALRRDSPSNPKADPAAVVGGSASSELMDANDQPETKP